MLVADGFLFFCDVQMTVLLQIMRLWSRDQHYIHTTGVIHLPMAVSSWTCPAEVGMDYVCLFFYVAFGCCVVESAWCPTSYYCLL